MFTGNTVFEFAVVDVGDGEGLGDTGVGVSEVSVLDLEAGVLGSVGNKRLYSR
jgi:hypothetical protein